METALIKEKIQSINDDSNVYLIDPLSEDDGFFSCAGKLIYVSRDDGRCNHDEIKTSFLDLQIHVRISSVQNNQTFKDDYYNLITYNGNLEDSNLESFVRLCIVYSKNLKELDFKEFFYSLVELFQLPSDQSKINIIGLYGELKFMENVYESQGIDISDCWHKRGSFSQYDFSNGKQNIEVKTTLKNDCCVTIKHNQIFGNHSCILAAVLCEYYDNGETVEELVTKMNDCPDAFNCLNFSINLEKELKRVLANDVKNTRFSLDKILLFDSKVINPFHVLPDQVENLKYDLDISELSFLDDDTSVSLLENF